MKKNKVKRMLALLLSASMLASVAACGSKDNTDDKNSQESKQEESKQEESKQEESKTNQSSEEVKEDPIEISWLAYSPHGYPDSESPIWKAVEEKYNVKFDIWTADNNNWSESLNARFAAGEFPDVMRLSSSDLDKLIEQELVGEITLEMLEEKAPSYMAAINAQDDPSAYFLRTMRNGKYYGFAYPAVTNTYAMMNVWRLDWLQNVGIDKVPETLEEFEEAMYKFTFEDPDGNGENDTYGMSSRAMHLVLGAFGEPAVQDFSSPSYRIGENANGELEVLNMNENTRKGLEILQKWYADGVIDPEFITGENQGGYKHLSTTFNNDRIGLTAGKRVDHWAPILQSEGSAGPLYSGFTELHDGKGYGEALVVGPAPVGPDGASGTWKDAGVGEPVVLGKSCVEDEKKLNVVMQMLNDFYGDYEYFKLVGYGIEGEDYTIDKETGALIELETDAQKVRERGRWIFAFTHIPPEFYKRVYGPMFEWADTEVYNAYLLQTTLPTSEIKNEIGSALNQLTQEYMIKIVTGEYSMDKFDEYVTLMKEAGVEDMLAEMNATWKEWKSK